MSVHNGMPFLKEAVESILSQSYKNFEFIIIDDASTDKTWRYLSILGDKRIKLVKNKENLGLAASLNIGLKTANGKYIVRMDADDVSLPKRLQVQLNFLEKHPEIDICGSWVNLINQKGNSVGFKKPVTTDNNIKKALKWYSPIIHPTFFAKKEFFSKLGGYNEKFDMAEDYELLMRTQNKFKMANVSEILLNWRIWNNRRSSKNMHEIDKKDLLVKIEAFKKGYFGPLYLLIIIRKILMTYLVPWKFKVKAAKFFNAP